MYLQNLMDNAGMPVIDVLARNLLLEIQGVFFKKEGGLIII